MTPTRSNAPALVVFAKAPVPGRCKTRLARRLGPVLATRIYRAMTEHVVAQAVAHAPGPVILACSPDTRAIFFQQLARRYGCRLVRQARGDLGRRMARALSQVNAGHSGAVVIGTDQPMLDETTLGDAFAGLINHDMVMAPSADGGYWLIGGTRIEPAVFRGIAWSTPRVARHTRTAMQRQGLSWHEATCRQDIDTLADWRSQPRSQRARLFEDAILPGRRGQRLAHRRPD